MFQNRTTEVTYTLDGKLATLTVKNSVTGDQVTRWVYGTTLADSGLASNALVRAKIYPDSDDAPDPLGNGADNSYDRVEFAYNRLGQVTAVKDQLETVHELEYDGLYQLKNLDRGDLNGSQTGISGTPVWEEDFAYDPIGNWHGSVSGYIRKTNGTTDLDQNRAHNQANEITDITENAGPSWVTPVQDKTGNMTTIPQPASLTNGYGCEWDAWNRLVRVKAGSNTVAEYEYDGLVRRTVKKRYAGGSLDETRHFYYSDEWQVLEERIDSETVAERQFIWGVRGVDNLVLRDRDADGNGSLDERLYGLDDFLNLTAVTDPSGTVQERYGYDAFGTSRVMDGSFGNRSSSSYDWETRFAEYRWDSETGLYQVRNRYLHAQLGRWMSRDHIGERGGTNLYGYLGDNPINRIDPLGLLTVNIWNYRGSKDAWGHASITLDDGTHISWWPGPDRKQTIPGVPIYSARPNDPQTFADDVRLEQMPPDVQVRIDGLDEDAIKAWWLDFKDKNQWKTLTQNCSTVAAKALREGGGAKGNWWTARNFVWTPRDVKRFADEINRELQKRKKSPGICGQRDENLPLLDAPGDNPLLPPSRRSLYA